MVAEEPVTTAAVKNLDGDWREIGLSVTDFTLSGCVRDSVKMEVTEQGLDRWSVCGNKNRLLAATGEHLNRIHLLDEHSKQYNEPLAREQTELLNEVDRRIREIIAKYEELGIDWSERLHELMRERPGPAPAESTSDVFDIHLCTNVSAVQEAVEIVHDNLDDLRYSLGNALSAHLDDEDEFATQEEKIQYIEELIIVGVYTGPVAISEATTPKWAFHHKGRALQHAHERFGDAQVANDNRYLWI